MVALMKFLCITVMLICLVCITGILTLSQEDPCDKIFVCSEDGDCEKENDVCFDNRKCSCKTLGYFCYIDPYGRILCDIDGDWEENEDVCYEKGKCDG